MNKKMGLWQAVSIAVGTMIGASIFSVFGLGASIAGHNLPLVFILSGGLALLVAYSYATLGAKIISNAGPMEFILRGLGDGVLTGALSILSWLTYVISIALFAKGFAGYFLPLFHLAPTPLSTALAETGIIALFLAINFLGSATVGRAELYIVLIKLSVLGVFIVLGLWTIHPEWLSPGFAPQEVKGTLYAVAVFFLSYMGFGLVTNASEDMNDPERNVPRAIYLSIFIVTLVYVAVSVVAVGNLPLAQIITAKDFALAEAAKPFLGDVGYLLISIGALFSIASALNATLYGGANIAYALARNGELPEFFERKGWFQAPEGLYITAGLSLLFALAFDLNGIAAITSAVFMVIYLFVLFSHYRLAPKLGGNRPFILFSLVVVFCVFVVLMVYQWRTNQVAFYTTWIAFAASVVLEMLYRTFSKREILPREILKKEMIKIETVVSSIFNHKR